MQCHPPATYAQHIDCNSLQPHPKLHLDLRTFFATKCIFTTSKRLYSNSSTESLQNTDSKAGRKQTSHESCTVHCSHSSLPATTLFNPQITLTQEMLHTQRINRTHNDPSTTATLTAVLNSISTSLIHGHSTNLTLSCSMWRMPDVTEGSLVAGRPPHLASSSSS